MQETKGDVVGSATLLDVDTVGPYLVGRGLVPGGAPLEATALGGGVSNVVLAVQAGGRGYVVKQSLPRLRVAEEWLARRDRVLTEAAALRWTRAVTPLAVPAVYDVDGAMWTVTIERAPAGWQDWKTRLLAGAIDPDVAGRLGSTLAAWHTMSRDGAAGVERFADTEVFEQLRVDPYYRTIMARHPALAPQIGRYVSQMEAMRRCLVHGDFSPKNVLLGGEGLWVVDFEVAHLGDPAFDVAFMLNHLMLKAIHRPRDSAGYEECSGAFWRAYHGGVPVGFCGPGAYVYGHVACLMLARVDGKSPAEYLTSDGQRHARALAIALLTSPPSAPPEAWRLLREEARR
jgi:aminoglycoside phosphotransferase (APT) family kinase protein